MSQKLRVLLVEDEDHLLDAIKLNLELEGYKVHAVKDGKTALKVFKDYEKQRKAGKDPVFNAKEAGIENTEQW